MNVEIFLMLLTVCSIITSILVEAVKRSFELFKKTYSANMIAFFVAMPVGCAGAMLYNYIFNMPVASINCIFAIFLGLANWVGAMLGYDKVIQAVNQIKSAAKERGI